jgi:uncharacterized protein (DUF302 family)
VGEASSVSGAGVDVRAIVTLRSPYPVPELLDRLAAIVASAGLMIFSRIEFSRDAVAAGLSLPPMAALIFGSPQSGTPVFAMAPLAGLDLPLRALGWTDSAGQAWLSYVDPAFLESRYEIPDALMAGFRGVHALCRAAIA